MVYPPLMYDIAKLHMCVGQIFTYAYMPHVECLPVSFGCFALQTAVIKFGKQLHNKLAIYTIKVLLKAILPLVCLYTDPCTHTSNIRTIAINLVLLSILLQHLYCVHMTL